MVVISADILKVDTSIMVDITEGTIDITTEDMPLLEQPLGFSSVV